MSSDPAGSSLRSQLLWASFRVSVPPLAVLSAVSLIVASRQIETGLRERLLAGARGAELALETSLDAVRARASVVASDPALVEALASGRQIVAIGLAERAIDVIGVDRTTILGADRRVIARGHLPAQYGDTWAETALDVARAEQSALRRGAAGAGMFVVAPIADSQRRVLGAVVAQKAIDYAALRQLESQFGLDFSIWDGDRLQATTLRSLEHITDAADALRAPSAQALHAGATHYFARTRSSGSTADGGVLMVALDTSAAAVLKARLVLLYVGVALALIALTVIGAFVSARRIAGPVRRLARVADSAARGSLDPASVSVEGPREIRELGASFGNMLAKRRQAEEELRLAQADLERRVVARTEELRQSEEHLRQARQLEALGRLAGGVAHDFNNVLMTITGNAELLGHDLVAIGAAEPIQEKLGEIQQGAAHAAAIVRQLMAFSRQQTIAPVVLDLGRVVLDLEKMLRRLCTEDIRLTLQAEPGLAPILADPTQLGQVLVNLVVNAQDALPKGGSVRVRVYSAEVEAPAGAAVLPPPGRYTCLEVADDGVGMAPETARRIFEPFFTTKAPGKGTGMGLATVHGIVKQCGAHIAVATTPGQGTTFRLHFPVVARAVPLPRSEREAPQRQRGREAILLCEDEPSVRALSASFLRSGGYEVLEACSGAQALEQAAKRPDVALLVTDMVMPEMNGVQLARRLRERLPRMRVLYVSGYTASVIDSRIEGAGQHDLIAKPFSSAELLARVRTALDAAQCHAMEVAEVRG